MVIHGLLRFFLRTVLLDNRCVINNLLLGNIDTIINCLIISAINQGTRLIHCILGDLINIRDNFIDAIDRFLVDVTNVLDIRDIRQVGYIFIDICHVLHVAHINDVINVNRCGHIGPFHDLLQNVRSGLLIHDTPCVGSCIKNLQLE